MPVKPSREEVLRAICSCQPCTWEDLLAVMGDDVDKRALRHVIADLIREGVVVKEANYERRKLEYRATSCPG